MNISLDGFADHTMAVVTDDELHHFFNGLLANVDTMVFGRVTYQLMESYWPQASEDPRATKGETEFAHKINSTHKIVFSKTLEKVTWNNSTLSRDSVVDEVTKLKQQQGKDISIGGLSLCQDLIRHRLIDEYWLVVQPVLWGSGKRLFDGVNERINLMLSETKTLTSGVVALHYIKDKK